MQVRIDGRRYNTDKAYRVCGRDNDRTRADFQHEEVCLYRTNRGEYFIHGEGGAATAWGFEDDNGSRAFGAGIFPVGNKTAAMIADAMKNSHRIRFERHNDWIGSGRAEQDPNGDLVVYIGSVSRFVPSAE